MMTPFIRIVCLISIAVLGVIEAKGSNSISYRATRYGSYYSSKYFSYSGGKGYARYSRVYNSYKNIYPTLYKNMFTWFRTPDFKIYKNTPSGYISVCKNYEADSNGTYLGIFTCPLPFVPESHAYCCGITNAQYCCQFWDIPLNVAATSICGVMGVLLLLLFIKIIVQICINRRRAQQEKQEQMCLRRIGRGRLLGRQPSMKSIPMLQFFENIHAESNYRDGGILTEDDDESVTETPEGRSETAGSRSGSICFSSKSDISGRRLETKGSRPEMTNNNITNEKRDISGFGEINSGFVGENEEETRSSTFDNVLKCTPRQNSTTHDDHLYNQDDQDRAFTDINGHPVLPPIKPLRKTSRVNFNCSNITNGSSWHLVQNGGHAK